jgi:hypothetical protein
LIQKNLKDFNAMDMHALPPFTSHHIKESICNANDMLSVQWLTISKIYCKNTNLAQNKV